MNEKGIRLAWVDNLRGYAILLVVLGYSMQYYGLDFDNNIIANIIYSFHMPLFMAISGFCSYKESIPWTLVGKRTKQLLLPTVFWTILICLFNGETIIDRLIFNPAYWFLVVLYLISVLSVCINRFAIATKIKSEYISLIIFILLFLENEVCHVGVLCFNVLYFHFFFYSLGFYLNKYRTRIKVRISPTACIVMTIIFILAALGYKKGGAPDFWRLPPVTYFFATGLLGVIFHFCVFKAYCDKYSKILSVLGKYTLGIYVIHNYIRIVSVYYMQFFSIPIASWIIVIVMWVLLTLSSLGASVALSKNRLTSLLVGQNFKK